MQKSGAGLTVGMPDVDFRWVEPLDDGDMIGIFWACTNPKGRQGGDVTLRGHLFLMSVWNPFELPFVTNEHTAAQPTY